MNFLSNKSVKCKRGMDHLRPPLSVSPFESDMSKHILVEIEKKNFHHLSVGSYVFQFTNSTRQIYLKNQQKSVEKLKLFNK
jgi:hypothetical protein